MPASRSCVGSSANGGGREDEVPGLALRQAEQPRAARARVLRRPDVGVVRARDRVQVVEHGAHPMPDIGHGLR
eukprot:12672022-Alexandrium_andersonii.AAC.1